MTVDERRLVIDIVVPVYNEEQVVPEFYIFQEVKRRPVYLVRGVEGSAGDPPPRPADDHSR